MRERTDDLPLALARTLWSEVGFVGADGALDAVALMPLVAAGAPLYALPYAERQLAERLAAAAPVTVAVTDPRLGSERWQPTAAPVRIRLEPDPEGRRFRENLLDEELRKHPPSRLLADSLVQRRDNWWFLPRLLLHIEQVGPCERISARDPDEGVLFWPEEGRLRSAAVAVHAWDADPVELHAGDGAPPGATGPACLLRHDYSPDLHRRAVLRLAGWFAKGALDVHDRRGQAELPGPLRLRARIGAARSLERACRRELATHH